MLITLRFSSSLFRSRRSSGNKTAQGCSNGFRRSGSRGSSSHPYKKPLTGIGNALLWPIGRAGAGHFRIESVARFIIGDRDEVLHPDLMFEHQQSNDVAPCGQITGVLKPIADIADDIRPPGGAEIELERMARIIDKDIAEVRVR